MKGYYEIEWEVFPEFIKSKKEEFSFEDLENKIGLKISEDFKKFMYRNNNSEYPDMSNYNLYDQDGEVVIKLYGDIESYRNYDKIIKNLEIARKDLGEIYYWHLPLLEIGQQKIIFDYTHCRENPPIVWVNEEIGPYEGQVAYKKYWKRYIAPTFKDFIEMIGDRNNPMGDWIDEDLLDDGTRVGK